MAPNSACSNGHRQRTPEFALATDRATDSNAANRRFRWSGQRTADLGRVRCRNGHPTAPLKGQVCPLGGYGGPCTTPNQPIEEKEKQMSNTNEAEAFDPNEAVTRIVRAIRSIAAGDDSGPSGLEALSIALAGAGLGAPLGTAVERGLGEVAEALRAGLSEIAEALSDREQS